MTDFFKKKTAISSALIDTYNLLYYFIQQRSNKDYIKEFKATTQHLQTRQQVKIVPTGI
jgi:hypothetical protein